MIDETVVERIQKIYQSSSLQEKQLLRQILEEISLTGDSETYEKMWLADFKEVPVSIDQFICDPYYLGSVNRNGDAVYPFWKQTVRDIFNHGNQYNEIILSGATRIGKTSTATIISSYMLYRLMLYKNPHEYFQKKAVSKFTVAFANLTKDLALGVAYREFNDTLKESPWFMDHGTVSRSDRNFYYIPEGDTIEIVPASDAAHLLGMQIWCLKGDTQILTTEGVKRIEDCVNTSQNILQLVDDVLVPTTADVMCTGYTDELIRIELEDGTIIEGTPEHHVMLSDGTYKALGDLSSSDDLLTLNINTEVDHMNLSCYDKLFKVYVYTSPKGKRYIGITSKSTSERWGIGGNAYKSNVHFWNAIQKYGWDNFTHEIVASDLSLTDACELETTLIAEYDTMNPDHGYNHTTGGNWSTPDKATRLKLSEAQKRINSDPEYLKKKSERLLGHPTSIETRMKISHANTGKKRSAEFCEKQRNRTVSEETRAKLRSHSSWSKGLTKDTDERVRRISEAQKGKPKFTDAGKQKLSKIHKKRYEDGYDPMWINNGSIETSIQRGTKIPDGFIVGRLSVLDTYIYRGSESKKISHSDIDSYLKDGWMLGRPKCVGDTIRKANQRMHWEYEGQRFESAQQLAEYLQVNGYPKIVSSTITALALKGFENSPTYHSLAGKIIKVCHENKIHTEN